MPRAEGSMEINGDSPAKPGSKTIRKAKTSNSNGHDCHICRKSNMTLSGLKIHLLTHSGEKPYLCTVCDKRFTCSSNLKKHQRIHNKDYIYACEVCGKTCSDPSNMKKHMTVHSGEKAYVCPSCGKSYSYAQSLRQHMDDVHVENGEKRNKSKRKGHFPCPECGKVFGYYWRCSLHQARVHAVDRPFKCPECGKCFARETILNKHLQTHEKPYACTECERRFSFRDQLHKHNRTHSGERPFQCETCLKAFSQRGSLTEHMRTHTGLKPFACQICGMKFASSSSLRRHERKVKSCFPAPQGEEIPMGSMYPRKAIYVPTPSINIPRVETRPVIDIQGVKNSYMRENSYIGETPYFRENSYFGENPSTSSSVAQISTANTSLFTENGFTSACSTTESNNKLHNKIAKNFDVNGNFEATMVPNSQISMVVRCDKYGKISVLPVTLELVNGTTGTDGELDDPTANVPVVNATSNHHHHESNTASDNDHQILSEPINPHVTIATSNGYHPSYTGISMSTNAMTNDIDSFSTMPNPTRAIDPPVHHSNTIRHHLPLPSPTNQAVFTNPALATNPPLTVSTKNSPSPTNQITSGDGTTMMDTNSNPPRNVKPVLLENQHHSPTNRQPSPSMVMMNGEYTNYHKSQSYAVATSRIPQFPPPTDANNNMVNPNVLVSNNHLPVKYSAVKTTHVNGPLCDYMPTNNGANSINHIDIPAGSVVAVTNNNQAYYNSSIMCGEVTNYNAPAVSTVNDHYIQSPPHILLPSSMIRRPLTTMEPPTSQSYFVKTEPEDIKPIIGIDVPAFDQ